MNDVEAVAGQTTTLENLGAFVSLCCAGSVNMASTLPSAGVLSNEYPGALLRGGEVLQAATGPRRGYGELQSHSAPCAMSGAVSKCGRSRTARGRAHGAPNSAPWV